ncbi:MAG TPA: class I SAM-dependent methyltransferase [Dehalococcoidia bacterium]|nr:class I SAM-dependent methyltransferase [Dehalococcoidia bacterium]
MTEARVGRDYNRWLRDSLSRRLLGLLPDMPRLILIDTPAFNLHEELQLKPEHRLLDIGCGSGALLQLMDSRVRFKHRPIGIDLSRSMLGPDRRDKTREELIQASGLALPFPDESIDVITCGHVVKRLDDDGLLQIMREMQRVLVKGGIALLWELAPTSSKALNAWNKRVVTLGVGECNLRNYTTLSAYALEADFDFAGNAHLRPFLFPPIPRVSLLLGKAPKDWSPGLQSSAVVEGEAVALANGSARP